CIWRHNMCRQIQPSRTLFKVPALEGGDLGVGDSKSHRTSVLMQLPCAFKQGFPVTKIQAMLFFTQIENPARLRA
ncbi:MAG: hypothetical protein VB089_07985, partial [Anaerolineaceae bacterium]|nr:hypothetical protein [Anaerolineaceae bacterium]